MARYRIATAEDGVDPEHVGDYAWWCTFSHDNDELECPNGSMEAVLVVYEDQDRWNGETLCRACEAQCTPMPVGPRWRHRPSSMDGKYRCTHMGPDGWMCGAFGADAITWVDRPDQHHEALCKRHQAANQEVPADA